MTAENDEYQGLPILDCTGVTPEQIATFREHWIALMGDRVANPWDILIQPANLVVMSAEHAALWQQHEELKAKIQAWKDEIESAPEEGDYFDLVTWLLDEMTMALS